MYELGGIYAHALFLAMNKKTSLDKVEEEIKDF